MDMDPESPVNGGDLDTEEFHSAAEGARSESLPSTSAAPGAQAGTASSPAKAPGPPTGSPARPVVPPLKLPSPPPPPPPGPASPPGDLSPSTASPSPRRSGAALFSVPPAEAPHSGVYEMPLEAFEFRDLDSGRTFYLDKRYWIKDVDTGNVYVLEPPEAAAATAATAATAGPGADSVRVSDLISGQDLSMEEFEQALGYFKEAPPAAAAPVAGGPDAAPGDVATQAQQLAQRGIQSLSLAAQASASWIRDKASAARDRLAPPRDSDRASYGAPAPSAAPPPRGDGAASPSSASPPSRPADGQGLPVKVTVSKKPFKELTDLRLVQTLPAHAGVVWAMRFSKSGRYLATAGQDCVVTVWEAVTHRERPGAGGVAGASPRPEPAAAGAAGAEDPGSPASSSSRGGDLPGAAAYGVPVLRPRPLRVYRGHRQDVLDVAWSKTNFLLSASMDKSVRLWHVSMDDCLRVFKHSDFVTAIAFHPADDKLFVSGSIDGKVRLWNVPEQRVASWQDVHDMVTAVGYSRDGRRAVVGTMRGKCRFYGVSARGGLEYEAQLDVKNKRGQHARGKKVTGLHFAPGAGGAGGDASPALLITSNDSRVRLYEGYTLRAKYKGHSNGSTQIRASFSPGGDYVICGSDDGAVYVWSTRKAAVPGSPERPGFGGAAAADDPAPKEKNTSFECFQVTNDVITVALFGPECTHRPLDAMSPTAAAAEGAGSGGAARPAVSAARGQVILAAGYSGEIKIYENVGLPQWL